MKTATVTLRLQGLASVRTLGLRSVRITSGNTSNPKNRSKPASVTRPMVNEPTMAPATTGTRIGNATRRPRTPRRRNDAVAAAFDVRIPTRFDPLALLPGTPARTSKGTVRIDPAPATALMVPASRPPPTSSNASHHVVRERL